MAHDERRESGPTDAIGERSLSHDEARTVKAAGAPATAAAGAIAGATAGLVTGPFGPIAAIVGALGGAAAGAAIGAAGSQATSDAVYTGDDDTHYRALWDGTPVRPADRAYDAYRPAYQFGHLAAQHRDYVGRDFDAAEPALRRAWDTDLRAQHGEWDAVRRYVHDAYGHARSLGYGVRRDAHVIGTAGSAVDPVELERARAGLPSVDTPVGAAPVAGDVAGGHGDDEISIVDAQREGREYI